MKRLLIIGASILQLPAILKAKEMGYCVAVADYNSNAVGIPYADKYYNVSTIDEEGIYQAAKDFSADGLMTLATDMPMRSVAYACKRLGLVGIDYDTAIKATDKGEMIKAFEEHGVAHPFYYILHDLTDIECVKDKLSYPVITKPTDNSGSRGVMLVNCEAELRRAVNYSFENGRNGDVIIEEYMVGPEVSVEIIVLDGIPHVVQITDKLTTGAPHFVELGHSQPSRLSSEDKEAISRLASRAALAVGILNGAGHAEIILTKDGPKMVEIGARMGGDCITTHLVPLSTGVDMVKAAMEIACGIKPVIDVKMQKASAIRFCTAKQGTLISIDNVAEVKRIPEVVEVMFTKEIGSEINDIYSSTDRVGYVITQADTVEVAVKKCEEAIKLLRINVD